MLMLETVSIVKQLRNSIVRQLTQFFAGHFPMPGAYIQACSTSEITMTEIITII